jgi:dihydropteroate synthase
LPQLAAMGYPVLAGVSRKRFIGDLTGRGLEDRVAGSVAAALLAVQNRASLVRVHDVKETVDAINVWMQLT